MKCKKTGAEEYGICGVCSVDSDCGDESFICTSIATCEECETTENCKDGKICVNNQCLECEGDGQCTDGKTCVDNVCVDAKYECLSISGKDLDDYCLLPSPSEEYCICVGEACAGKTSSKTVDQLCSSMEGETDCVATGVCDWQEKN